MLKVLKPFYDIYNPERTFEAGDYIHVNDKERMDNIINRGLAVMEDVEKTVAIILDPAEEEPKAVPKEEPVAEEKPKAAPKEEKVKRNGRKNQKGSKD